MVAIPDALRRGIEREVAGVDRSRLREATDRLMTTYQRERPASSAILRDELDVLAYAAYRLPATWAAVRHVLGQVEHLLTPTTMLDVGGGSGAATWAATDVCASLAEVTVVDRVPEALQLGERLRVGVPGPSVRWRTGTVDSLDGDRVDLAVAAYVLGELSPAMRGGLVDVLAERAQTIAIVEPGTPTGHERVLEARAQIVAAGWHVAAPCPHATTCPWAGPGEWCHVAARVQRIPVQRQLKGGTMGHEDEKLAYVVATRDPVPRPDGRVVRHPVTRKGMVQLTVCHADGEIHDVTVTKRDPAAWRQVRRTDWGDPWPAPTT